MLNGKFVSLRIILFSFIFFLLLPSSAFAQVSIGKFYSQGTYKNKPLDWVEIVNNSSSQINLKGYQIKDSNLSETNTYEFEGDTLLNSGQSCVKEVGQILNKDEDIIYIFSGGNQIFCLEYGTGKSDCNKTSDMGLESEKPVADCTTVTPPPTQAPTKQPTPNPTPVPSKITAELIDSAPSITPSASPASKPEVKAATIKNSKESTDEIVVEEERENVKAENNQKNWLGYPFVVSGIATSGYGIFLLRNKLKGKYNNEYGQFKQD